MSKESGRATIVKTGPGTSIQDLGRRGMANFGVPVSGAMDLRSAHWVNHVLQNDENASVLEISQPGFSIRFNSPTAIALAGAIAEVSLNGVKIAKTDFVTIHTGDLLAVGAFSLGARLYLGIRKGFQTKIVLGSRSFYKGLTEVCHLSSGAELAYSHSTPVPTTYAKARWSPDWYTAETVFAYPGPDFPLVGEQLKLRLTQESFRISTLANRMGIQLSELLENNLPELPTNPVFPGIIQLTPGGKLIILLKDAQVTGGYPRILVLQDESQWIIAQKKPGDSIRFQLLDSQKHSF
jgi:biotin-dependent carboxylase-like uncharacterized protein